MEKQRSMVVNRGSMVSKYSTDVVDKNMEVMKVNCVKKAVD